MRRVLALLLLAAALAPSLATAHGGLTLALPPAKAPGALAPVAEPAPSPLPRALEVAHVVAARDSSLAPEMGTPDYSIAWQCPDVPLGVVDTTGACPLRLVDGDDLLGNPGLVVDPLVPGRLAFASLHGGVGSSPSPLSRDGQTHTTYTSFVFGQNWEDQPYTPPTPPFGSEEVYGEDVHALVDTQTRTLHVASLYAWKDEGWRRAIVTWKFSQDTRQLEYNLVHGYFESRTANGDMGPLWLVELPDAGLVALLWRESAPVNTTVTIQGVETTSWIAGALTLADPVTEWAPFEPGMLVPDCPVATNPVAHGARIYIGCDVDGLVRMHELDTATFSQRPVGAAPLGGGHPLLSITEDEGIAGPETRLALATARTFETTVLRNVTTGNLTRVDGNATGNATMTNATNASTLVESVVKQPRVAFAIARVGDQPESPLQWGDVRTLDDLGNLDRPPVSARLTALLYRNETETLHFILSEQGKKQENETDWPMWRKSLVVSGTLGDVLVDLDLDLSDKGEVFFDPGNAPRNHVVYGDTRDTLVEIAGREWMAFNDYSVIVIAEILEFDRRLQPLAFEAPPPVPQPAPAIQSTANVLTTNIGVVAGVGVAAAAARYAMAKFGSASGAGRGRR